MRNIWEPHTTHMSCVLIDTLLAQSLVLSLAGLGRMFAAGNRLQILTPCKPVGNWLLLTPTSKVVDPSEEIYTQGVYGRVL